MLVGVTADQYYSKDKEEANGNTDCNGGFRLGIQTTGRRIIVGRVARVICRRTEGEDGRSRYWKGFAGVRSKLAGVLEYIEDYIDRLEYVDS